MGNASYWKADEQENLGMETLSYERTYEMSALKS